jgi:hypothetical protein
MMNLEGLGSGRGRGVILRYYPGIRLEGLGKITKNLWMPGLRAVISTRDLPNTEQVTIRTISEELYIRNRTKN